MFPVKHEGKWGEGFYEKLVICPTCGGTGLSNIRPNSGITDPRPDETGPWACRRCNATGAVYETRDPGFDAKSGRK